MLLSWKLIIITIAMDNIYLTIHSCIIINFQIFSLSWKQFSTWKDGKRRKILITGNRKVRYKNRYSRNGQNKLRKNGGIWKKDCLEYSRSNPYKNTLKETWKNQLRCSENKPSFSSRGNASILSQIWWIGRSNEESPRIPRSVLLSNLNVITTTRSRAKEPSCRFAEKFVPVCRRIRSISFRFTIQNATVCRACNSTTIHVSYILLFSIPVPS